MKKVKYPAHIVGLCQELAKERRWKAKNELWLILGDALEEINMPESASHVKLHYEVIRLVKAKDCAGVIQGILEGKACVYGREVPNV